MSVERATPAIVASPVTPLDQVLAAHAQEAVPIVLTLVVRRAAVLTRDAIVAATQGRAAAASFATICVDRAVAVEADVPAVAIGASAAQAGATGGTLAVLEAEIEGMIVAARSGVRAMARRYASGGVVGRDEVHLAAVPA